MRKLLSPAALATVLTAAALTTGCATLFEQAVGADELETQIAAKLGGQLGGTPRSVDCPADLRGVVGSTVRCSLVTANGTERVVNVTVTSVDGERVDYDITSPAPTGKPSNAPATPATQAAPLVTQAQVEAEALRQLTPQLDGTPRSVTCPGGLRGEPGASLECTLHFVDGTSRQITVTVTTVEGTTVNFDIRLGGADG